MNDRVGFAIVGLGKLARQQILPALARTRETGVEHGVCAAARRVAGERDFAVRREDAQAITGRRIFGRQHERRLDQVRPPGDALHRCRAQVFGADHDPERIAAAERGGKDIELEVAERRHGRVTRRASAPAHS